jgi:hypothetical protein
MGRFQMRDLVSGPDMCTPWLCGHDTNAEKFQYVLGAAFDMLLQKQYDAMTSKCPGRGDRTAIPFQAADRLLVQGPAETGTSFVERLKGAFDAWSRAGSRRAILEQIQAYLTNLQPGVAATLPECTIVGGNTDLTTWDTIYGYMAQGAVPAHRLIEPANWDWDGRDQPWRALLVLYMHLVATGQSGNGATVSDVGGSGVSGVTSGFAEISGLSGMNSSNIQQYLTVSNQENAPNNGTFQIVHVSDATRVTIATPNAVLYDASGIWSVGAYPFIAPAPVWGSPQFIWGDTHTWGLNCSPFVLQSIRQIVQRWKSSGSYYPAIIVSFGGSTGVAGSEFSPLSSEGAGGNPDGTWSSFGRNVNGVWVPARQSINKFTACCQGTGRSIQCYEENVT